MTPTLTNAVDLVQPPPPPSSVQSPDDISRVAAVIRESWSVGLAPPPTLSISKWADKNRWVAAPSPEIGWWRTVRTPYLAGIMEVMSPLHPAREVDLMKATQIGGTEALLNCVGFYSHLSPTTGMVVLPSKDVAEEWSKIRFEALFESTPALAGLIQSTSLRKQSSLRNTTFLKRLRGGIGSWKFAWSTSGKVLRSTPAEIVIADEVDAFEIEVSEEGDPVDLLRKRISNYPRGKLILCSSPTSKSSSRIEFAFNEGDQRYFFVPCPDCSYYQRFIFSNLYLDDHGPYFSCIHCKHRIREHHKTQFLPAGIWVATKKHKHLIDSGFQDVSEVDPIVKSMQESPWASFHLPAFYAPYGWTGASWPSILTEWGKAKIDPNKRRVFVNTVQAETWADETTKLDWEKLWARREAYEIGQVPLGGLFLTAACDVQADRLEVEVKAWGRGKQSWPIWYEVVPGSPDSTENWARLAEILSSYWPTAAGGLMQVTLLVVDSGYRSDAVYDFVCQFPQLLHGPAGSWAPSLGTVAAVKGDNGEGRVVSNVTSVDAARRRTGIRVVTLGTSYIKDELYAWMKLPKNPDGSLPIGFCHMPDYPGVYGEYYFQGLTSEIKVVKKSGKAEWTRDPAIRNEPLDLAVYNRAAAHLCGIDGFREGHWQALEAKVSRSVLEEANRPVEPTGAVETTVEPQSPTQPPPPPQLLDYQPPSAMTPERLVSMANSPPDSGRWKQPALRTPNIRGRFRV